jgi:hypothetical protein
MNKLTLEEQFLTLEQAKELQDLGVDFSNANFAFINVINPYNSTFKHEITKYYVELRNDLIPTLSVAEMLEMLPDYIRIEHYIGKWNVGDCHNSIYPHNIDKVLLRDALFEMLKWLKTNKLI